MQRPGPNLGSPADVGPEPGPVFCFVGTVNLIPLVPPPQPGAILGQLTTSVGVGVPLIQTSSSLFGHGTLASVDRQLATVCGNLLFRDGRLAVDVAFVSPGVSTTTPGLSSLALVVLSLLGLLPAAG
jgi:hypothetical protein